MSYVYGSRDYGQGFYGGRDEWKHDLFRGALIDVYDPTGAIKGAYQTGSGNLLSVTFSHDDNGCKDFMLSFSTYANIDKGDRVLIRLFDGDAYFFRGVVRFIPIDGSTKNEYIYGGFGYAEYFSRMNTEELNYVGDTVEDILYDLIDNVITVKSPINRNDAKIQFASEITVTEVTWHYIQVKEALKQLQDIMNSDGNDYIYGVDSFGDFFFKPRDTEVKKTLVVSKRGRDTIDGYEPEDSYEAKSKLFVLKKDGTFYGTYVSTEDIDIFEEKLTAPDIDDNDIDNWANGQLLIKEQETRQASIRWRIERINPTALFCDGYLRIISQIPPNNLNLGNSYFGRGLFGAGLFGGNQYDGKLVDDTLKIKSIAYTISGQEAMRDIQLGAIPVRLDREMLEIHEDVSSLRVSLGR